MFETALAHLTASAGLPLRWVENPEWLALCKRFLPNAKSPSCKVCYVTAGTFARRGLSSTAKTLRSLVRVRGCEY